MYTKANLHAAKKNKQIVYPKQNIAGKREEKDLLHSRDII